MNAYKSHLLTVSAIALTLLCSPIQASGIEEELKENKDTPRSGSFVQASMNHRGEPNDANEKNTKKEVNNVNHEKFKEKWEQFSSNISNIFKIKQNDNIDEKNNPKQNILTNFNLEDNNKEKFEYIESEITLKPSRLKKNIEDENFTHNIFNINQGKNLINLNSNFNQLYSQDTNKNKDELSYENLRHELHKHFVTHKVLLNSSQNKDIVVFLGKTGAGKSTLINYLSGKKLIFNNDEIILKNSKDLEAMEIGIGEDSQTTHPKSIQYDDLLLYDFPGFEDTRGLSVDLLTLNFVNSLLEKAKTVRLVFVAGEGEIEDVRGESLKKVIKIADDLIEEGMMRDLSSLVITKCNVSKTVEALGSRIKKKCGNHDILEEWINKGRLAQMSFPQEEEIREDEREKIFTAIMKSTPTKIKNIKGTVLLKDVAPYRIREVFEQARNVHEKESENKVAEVISPIKMNEMHEWEKMRWNIMKLYHTQVFTNDSVIRFLKDTNMVLLTK
jgi:predicted GTPase